MANAIANQKRAKYQTLESTTKELPVAPPNRPTLARRRGVRILQTLDAQLGRGGHQAAHGYHH